MSASKLSHTINSRSVRFPFILFALALLLAASFYFSRSHFHQAIETSRFAPPAETEPTKKDSTRIRSNDSGSGKLRVALLNLPLSFEPGSQTNEFLAAGAGYSLLLRPGQSLLAFAPNEPDRRISGRDRSRDVAPRDKTVSIELVGANKYARGSGVDELPGKRNYLLGNDPSRWRTNVSTFAKVRYENLYPGIDLIYYGNPRQLEYDFELAPGADPNAIRFAFDRNTQATISAEGELVLKTEGGEFRQQRPLVYQNINGARRVMEARYELNDKQAGFEIGLYDRTKPLVIDPTLVYSTYLGGGGDDSGSSIAVDSSNNVYITGTTNSTNFPTQGPAFPSNAGLSDIFV